MRLCFSNIFSNLSSFLVHLFFNFGTWFSICKSFYVNSVKTNQFFEHASCSHVFLTGSYFRILYLNL